MSIAREAKVRTATWNHSTRSPAKVASDAAAPAGRAAVIAAAIAMSFAHAASRSARAVLLYFRRSTTTGLARIARSPVPRRRSASTSAAENGGSDGAPGGAGTGRSRRSRTRSRTRSPSPPSQPCSVVKWTGANRAAAWRSPSGVSRYRSVAAPTIDTAYVFRGTRSAGRTRKRPRHAAQRASGTAAMGFRPEPSSSPRKIAPRSTWLCVSLRPTSPQPGHGVSPSQYATPPPP